MSERANIGDLVSNIKGIRKIRKLRDCIETLDILLGIFPVSEKDVDRIKGTLTERLDDLIQLKHDRQKYRKEELERGIAKLKSSKGKIGHDKTGQDT